MNEFIKKLIERLEEKIEITWNHDYLGGRKDAFNESIEIVNQLAEEYGDGWILCEKEMPPQPEENPAFDNRPVELYLVSEEDADYPFRAFWNGKYFTDGFGKVEVIAWQPLPTAYRTEGE